MHSSSAKSTDLVLRHIISGNKKKLRRLRASERASVSLEETSHWFNVQRQPVDRNGRTALLIPALKHSLPPHLASDRKSKLDYVFTSFTVYVCVCVCFVFFFQTSIRKKGLWMR